MIDEQNSSHYWIKTSKDEVEAIVPDHGEVGRATERGREGGREQIPRIQSRRESSRQRRCHLEEVAARRNYHSYRHRTTNYGGLVKHMAVRVQISHTPDTIPYRTATSGRIVPLGSTRASRKPLNYRWLATRCFSPEKE